MFETKIHVQRLKEFAFDKLPKDSALREILLAESEELDALTFLARLPIWLRLMKLKRGDSK